MTASPLALSFHRIFIHAFVTILLPLSSGWFCCGEALAESAAPTAQRTTLVVFADHHMPDEEWTDLFAAVRREQAATVSVTPKLAVPEEIIRGDKVKPGLRVDAVITVFLHGDCILLPRPRLIVEGALGWVPRSKGIIEPFVNVNCTQLVNMLGPFALGMNSDRRNFVMAEAMARVIVHEWIHIVTQSAHHGSHGVTRSEFGVRDLLAEDSEIWFRLGHKRI